MFETEKNEIEAVLALKGNSSYKYCLGYLLECYNKFSKKTKIVDYFVSEQSLFLSFKKEDMRYFVNINLTKQYLELQFNSCEVMLMFDDESDITLANEMLDSFCSGQYKIFTKQNAVNKSFSKELRWDSNNLKSYNSEFKISYRPDNENDGFVEEKGTNYYKD